MIDKAQDHHVVLSPSRHDRLAVGRRPDGAAGPPDTRPSTGFCRRSGRRSCRCWAGAATRGTAAAAAATDRHQQGGQRMRRASRRSRSRTTPQLWRSRAQQRFPGGAETTTRLAERARLWRSAVRLSVIGHAALTPYHHTVTELGNCTRTPLTTRSGKLARTKPGREDGGRPSRWAPRGASPCGSYGRNVIGRWLPGAPCRPNRASSGSAAGAT